MNQPSFADFFKEATGFTPFPWQTDLANELSSSEPTWPTWLALPTGVGKTSLLAIWAWALAVQATSTPKPRTMPLRCIYVVDRRLLVDAADTFAHTLADRLATASSDSATGYVARALRQLSTSSADRPPIAVASLRGGRPRLTHWIQDPTQPAILTSTIDQAGSRLLFRGYGVSHRTWSLEAGLLGVDALWVVDEAHLAPALLNTLATVRKNQIDDGGDRSHQDPGVSLVPLRILALSATPPDTADSGGRFELTDADYQDTVLKPRLTHPKHIEWNPTLPQSKTGKARRPSAGSATPLDALALRLVVHALNEAKKLEAPAVVGIVVNRIVTARKVADLLRACEGIAPDHVLTLHSRFRPFDIQQRLKDWQPYLQTGRSSEDSSPAKRFVVATQTVEVGVDWDFDALVTELAPWSALGQRLGRLNRAGRREEASAIVVSPPKKLPSHVLIYPSEVLAATEKVLETKTRISTESTQEKQMSWDDSPQDPSKVLAATEKVLKTQARTGPKQQKQVSWDGSPKAWVEATKKLSPEDRKALDPPTHQALPFLPGALRQLTLTSLPNAQDPQIAYYLHRWDYQPVPEVAIAWRHWENNPSERPEEPPDSLAVAPPTRAELLMLPVWAVRRWLASSAQSSEKELPVDLADIPTSPKDNTNNLADIPTSPKDNTNDQTSPIQGWIQEADMSWRPFRTANDLKPYSLLVLDARIGGYTPENGWDPAIQEPVPDCGNAAAMQDSIRSFRAVRLQDSEVLRQLLSDIEDPEIGPTIPELENWVQTTQEFWPPDSPERQAVRGWLQAHKTLRQILWSPREHTVLLRWTSPKASDPNTVQGSVDLDTHQSDVEKQIEQWAASLRLSEPLTMALKAAARHHDDGKKDERMQRLLQRSIDGDLSPPLAKRWPLLAPSQAKAWRDTLSLPDHWRHEVGSLSSATLFEDKDCHHDNQNLDLDLVQHLIASHHGYGRPWFPFEPPDHTSDVQWSQAARFLAVQKRYGPWGLAWLEMLLRLADWAASSNEAQSKQTGSKGTNSSDRPDN